MSGAHAQSQLSVLPLHSAVSLCCLPLAFLPFALNESASLPAVLGLSETIAGAALWRNQWQVTLYFYLNCLFLSDSSEKDYCYFFFHKEHSRVR